MAASFTNLLDQTVQANAAPSETLADTLRKHAKQLTDEDLTVLVAGLREQRSRWSTAQASGDKKLVTSKKIPAKRKNANVSLTSGFAIKRPVAAPGAAPTTPVVKKPIL